MHELSLAESVLTIVQDVARANDAKRVTHVRLLVGALSHVDADALRFCFDVVKRDSVAADAGVELIAVPGSAWCMPCGTNVAIAGLADACPVCGSHQLQVVSGQELSVKDIEVA